MNLRGLLRRSELCELLKRLGVKLEACDLSTGAIGRDKGIRATRTGQHTFRHVVWNFTDEEAICDGEGCTTGRRFHVNVRYIASSLTLNEHRPASR